MKPQKTIYFVRHGESEANALILAAGKNTSLTPYGRKQAQFIAKRSANLPVDIIISSSLKRAQQTAQIIQEKIKKPLEFSDFFIERRRPKEQIGKKYDDPQLIKIDKEILKNFGEGFRFSDEDNFDDLKKRAAKALKFLENRQEKNILVVTHANFSKIIMAYIFFGKELTGKECRKFMSTLQINNTGISVFQFNPMGKPKWRAQTWNDHAHLG